MLIKWRQALASRFATVVDAVELGVLLFGSGLSMVFGKLLAAVLFAILAAGVASRFMRRRNGSQPAPALPLWGTLVAGGLSIIEAAMVAEAINLPVRFDQPGFEKSNLLLVVAMLVVFYVIQRSLLQRFFGERTRAAIRS